MRVARRKSPIVEAEQPFPLSNPYLTNKIQNKPKGSSRANFRPIALLCYVQKDAVRIRGERSSSEASFDVLPTFTSTPADLVTAKPL